MVGVQFNRSDIAMNKDLHEMDPQILRDLESLLEYQIGQTNQELKELLPEDDGKPSAEG